ncbi:MAG: tyrosine-type recombinase/integrase, partial [Dehalococcoidia bacterium]
MDDLVAAYIRYLEAERNLSPFTLRNYRTDLAQFFAYLEEREDMSPLAVDRQAFRRYLAWSREQGTAGASVARKVSTVHSFYRFLVRSGCLSADPLLGVRPPKRERRLPGVLSRADIEALIAAADGDSPQALRDRTLLELMYAAGVRLGEVVALDLGDLDMDERSLRVRGKGNKERIVLFGGPAGEVLRAYLKKGRPSLACRRDERALFLNRAGRRLSARSVEVNVRKYALRAGLGQRVYPHLLRHTFATHLLDG